MYMDFTDYTRERAKHDAIIHAQIKLLGMLEMSHEIKEKTDWMILEDRVRLYGIIDEIWKQEQVNCAAVKELNK